MDRELEPSLRLVEEHFKSSAVICLGVTLMPTRRFRQRNAETPTRVRIGGWAIRLTGLTNNELDNEHCNLPFCKNAFFASPKLTLLTITAWSRLAYDLGSS
jgi:hypothetical protein